MTAMVKRVLIGLLAILALLFFAVPVAADTPRTPKPSSGSSSMIHIKGVVTAKAEGAFAVKGGEDSVRIAVDGNTRFYVYLPQEIAPPAVKPIEPPKTTTRDPGNKTNSPESKTVTAKTAPPERTKTAPPANVTPGKLVTYADLKVGDTVVVEAVSSSPPLAKAVTIYPPARVGPIMLTATGIVVSVNEARGAFAIQPSRGETMTFKYNKNTSFSILGSASLQEGMLAGVMYIAEDGALVAGNVKASFPTPESTAKKE